MNKKTKANVGDLINSDTADPSLENIARPPALINMVRCKDTVCNQREDFRHPSSVVGMLGLRSRRLLEGGSISATRHPRVDSRLAVPPSGLPLQW